MGQTMSHSILGCRRLANPFSSAAATRSIRFSPARSLPHLRQPLYRYGNRSLQFLGEELHAQFLEQPAELLEAGVGLAGSRLLELLALPLRDQRRDLGSKPRVALRIGAQL